MPDVAIGREETALFRPETYAAVRRPLLESSTFPPHSYTSPEFYKREVQTIFMKVWNFIGRGDRIANAGDYFPLEFPAVPAIVDRGVDCEILAFANTRPH